MFAVKTISYAGYRLLEVKREREFICMKIASKWQRYIARTTATNDVATAPNNITHTTHTDSCSHYFELTRFPCTPMMVHCPSFKLIYSSVYSSSSTYIHWSYHIIRIYYACSLCTTPERATPTSKYAIVMRVLTCGEYSRCTLLCKVYMQLITDNITDDQVYGLCY